MRHGDRDSRTRWNPRGECYRLKILRRANRRRQTYVATEKREVIRVYSGRADWLGESQRNQRTGPHARRSVGGSDRSDGWGRRIGEGGGGESGSVIVGIACEILHGVDIDGDRDTTRQERGGFEGNDTEGSRVIHRISSGNGNAFGGNSDRDRGGVDGHRIDQLIEADYDGGVYRNICGAIGGRKAGHNLPGRVGGRTGRERGSKRSECVTFIVRYS